MSRILAVDFGTKRVGLAVTDTMQMIAGALTTVHAKDVVAFIDDYLKKETVECIVVGHPLTLQNTDSANEKHIKVFIQTLKNKIPGVVIERYDERFTSLMAQQTMLAAGLKKKDRQNKSIVDKTSAVLILQSYLLHKNRVH
jgi:putative Holliday junction resolvase